MGSVVAARASARIVSRVVFGGYDLTNLPSLNVRRPSAASIEATKDGPFRVATTPRREISPKKIWPGTLVPARIWITLPGRLMC